jgi:hypothetical protein
VDIAVVLASVDTGLRTAAELAGWRLAMAEGAAYLRTLAPSDRAALAAEAADAAEAAAPSGGPMARDVLLLTARAPAD